MTTCVLHIPPPGVSVPHLCPLFIPACHYLPTTTTTHLPPAWDITTLDFLFYLYTWFTFGLYLPATPAVPHGTHTTFPRTLLYTHPHTQDLTFPHTHIFCLPWGHMYTPRLLLWFEPAFLHLPSHTIHMPAHTLYHRMLPTFLPTTILHLPTQFPWDCSTRYLLPANSLPASHPLPPIPAAHDLPPACYYHLRFPCHHQTHTGQVYLPAIITTTYLPTYLHTTTTCHHHHTIY